MPQIVLDPVQQGTTKQQLTTCMEANEPYRDIVKPQPAPEGVGSGSWPPQLGVAPFPFASEGGQTLCHFCTAASWRARWQLTEIIRFYCQR